MIIPGYRMLIEAQFKDEQEIECLVIANSELSGRLNNGSKEIPAL